MMPLSYTAATAYLHCPFYFKGRYFDRLPERPRGEFNLGNALHAALEFFHRGSEPPTLDALIDRYLSEWGSAGFRSKEQEKEMFKAGEGWLRGYHAKYSTGYRRPLYVEHRFRIDIEGVEVLGGIDRVDRMEDGKLEVIDYKSGDVSPEEVRTNLQLGLYQLGLQEDLGAEVGRLTIFHIPTLTPLSSPPRTDDEIKAIKAEVLRVARGIRARRFEPKRNDWCPCDYASICPYYKHLYAITHAGSKLVDLRGICDEVDALAAHMISNQEIGDAAKAEGDVRKFLHANDILRVYGSRYGIELRENRLVAEEITQAERDEMV